jgi:hypothetical protein
LIACSITVSMRKTAVLRMPASPRGIPARASERATGARSRRRSIGGKFLRSATQPKTNAPREPARYVAQTTSRPAPKATAANASAVETIRFVSTTSA